MIGMSSQSATGTFEIDSWDDDIFDEGEAAKLGRTRLTKTFQGDVQGTSVVNMLGVSVPGENDEFQGVAYVAVERVNGSVHGRKGSFVLMHTAGPDGFAVKIVPGTGGAELAGITGQIIIKRDEDGSHTYTLEYEL